MTVQEQSLKLAKAAAKAADDKLAEQIAIIDVHDHLVITDLFVVVTGDNERHVNAIVDEVEDQLRDIDARPIRREGTREGRWALLDYGDIVVHVFRRDERQFYGLDRLWRDCPLLEVEGIETYQRTEDWSEDVNVFAVDSIDQIPLAEPEPDEGEL
ncbi:ribosome silencing factor [Corynebacterium choanae]|uniref:Ribosomal silencing factor RsfS n=1 Tax=Corynebacterium choanae TaxID=1862358 RepID=A0A3G6J7S8_9CORY|nr:ribosome silencing factor [Corynebacterium choanae]AZA14107.1 Ribosomal silencing factor RsfS [Corynebacterium choanae]